MVHHGMAGEADLAGDAHALGPRLHALELDPLARGVALDARKALEEIEVPPRAPVLAVGHRGQADLLLLADESLDLAILDGAEVRGRDLAALVSGARVLEGR